MKKQLTIFLVFTCFSISVFSQKHDLNTEDFKIVSIDSSLSWMRENTYTGRNLDAFHTIGLQTLKRSLKNEPSKKIAEIHEELANWHGYNGIFSPDSVVYHSEKALKFYQKIDDKKKIADTYRALSIDYMNVRKLDKAQEVLFKAIMLYEDMNDLSGLGSAYRSLGVLYQVMKEFEKSIQYTNKAIPILEKAGNFSSVAIAQFNLIIGYGELGEFEKAYKAADYCLETVRTKAPEEIFIPVRAYSYRGEVYVKAKDYANALKDFISAWELCKVNIGEERCATYRTEIGQVYLFQNDYVNALENLSIGLKAYEDKGQDNIIQQYLDLATCYENLGDYKNAMFYKDKASLNTKKMLEDKVTNLQTETVVKYETGKKDEAIANQVALLQQKSKAQNLIIAIATLLGLLLLSLLFFFNKNKKATKIIQAKNAENELLLKEIHHRVKNNLELVKSLISLQSAQLEDSATKDAMIASQNRVQSMGIIHQKLYQGKNLGSIEMKDYFLNLGEGILDTFNADEKVKIECAMDNLELDVDTAVPIGLIVNELLTNALKYAFPENLKGNISISLSKSNPETLTLKVVDNGIGKTAGLAPKGTGFGSQLIKLLTQQLNGKMTEENQNGTSVLFHFKLRAACILLLFCFQLSFAQKPTKSLDSVVNWVTTNVTVYKDSTIAYQKAHKTLKAVLKHGDTSLIAQSYANLANWHSYHFYIFKTPDSVLYYDKKALELYISIKDTVKSIEAHGNITLDYISRKQYNLAEKEAFKTIALCKASKNELSLSLNYINLADIYTLTHNTVSAVQYADKGILLIKKLNNKEELGFAYSATIETYLQNKDYQKVLQQSNETIRIFKELGIGDNDILKAYNGRGSAYKHLGEYDKALKDYLYVLTEAKKLYGEAIGGGYAHYVGETYMAQQNYEAALPYLNEGVSYAITFNEPNFLWRRYEALSNCLKHLNQYAEALKYSGLAEVLKDSMHNETIKSLQSELLVKYETAQKDETITAQDSQIAQQRKTQLLYVGIAVLLALGLLGMFLSLKSIRKKRKALQSLNIELDSKNQQNELLLKEIHHRVKNNLELVKSLISLQSAQLEDSATKDAMIASQNRVQSMGIIHQKLYQGENLGSIEMKDYFLNLGEGIL
ncbi:MAG: histidine kinase dimerization/phosphoacceptor domain -containing protein, partial [Flavobacteriaceae bacterium]